MNRPLLLFLTVFVGAMALRPLPGVGELFGSPLIYLAFALGLAGAVTFGVEAARTRRILARGVARLANASSPFHQGKLGALYLGHGRAREAIQHLERAAAGEPHIVDWHFRLGQAHAKLGRPRAALAAWDRAFALAPDHGFGVLRLARVAALARCGETQRALDELDAYERHYAASPESAFRAGVLLTRLGNADAARQRFDEVGRLAAKSRGHQRRSQRLWTLRAQFARLAGGLPLPRVRALQTAGVPAVERGADD